MSRLNRRNFLKVLGAGMTASSLGASRVFLNSAHAAPIGGRKVVNIFLNGGCDMFIPIQPTGFGSVMDQLLINRSTLALPLINSTTSSEYSRLALNGSNYTLHDQMTEFQTLFNRAQSQCAILLKAGIVTNNTGSHEEAQKDHQTGVDAGNEVDNRGWMLKIAESSGFNDSYNVVDLTGGGIATGASARSSSFRPMALNSLSEFGFRAELGVSATGEYGFRLDRAMMLVESAPAAGPAQLFQENWDQLNQTVSVVQTAFSAECGTYNAASGTCTGLSPQFPNTSIGRQLRDIFVSFRQLPTRLAYAEVGGYDLHANSDPRVQNPTNRQGMSSRLRDLNAAISSFRQNCERTGIWDDIIIVINTEFGRTNRENVTNGLDHADASLVFLVGGAVQGGVYGEDFTVAELTRPQNGIDAQIKIRDVYCDIIQGLSLNPALAFPGFTRTPLGIIRPV